jgi:hypothetical protein
LFVYVYVFLTTFNFWHILFDLCFEIIWIVWVFNCYFDKFHQCIWSFQIHFLSLFKLLFLENLITLLSLKVCKLKIVLNEFCFLLCGRPTFRFLESCQSQHLLLALSSNLVSRICRHRFTWLTSLIKLICCFIFIILRFLINFWTYLMNFIPIFLHLNTLFVQITICSF